MSIMGGGSLLGQERFLGFSCGLLRHFCGDQAMIRIDCRPSLISSTLFSHRCDVQSRSRGTNRRQSRYVFCAGAEPGLQEWKGDALNAHTVRSAYMKNSSQRCTRSRHFCEKGSDHWFSGLTKITNNPTGAHHTSRTSSMSFYYPPPIQNPTKKKMVSLYEGCDLGRELWPGEACRSAAVKWEW